MIDIEFDLDDTLVDLKSVAVPIIFDRTGVDISECKNFDICTEFGIDYQDLWDCFHLCYSMWKVIPIIDGAGELLNALYHESGDPIKIVTSRGRGTHEYTRKLCDRLGVPYDLRIINPWESKTGHVNTQYFVDDRLETAIELKSDGVYCFIPEMSYNRPSEGLPDGAHPIKTVADLMDYLEVLVCPK